MGIDDGKLEMLFISPAERGRGLGRKLLEHGIKKYGVIIPAASSYNIKKSEVSV